MNVFNRIIMIVCILVSLAVVALVMRDPLWAIDMARTGLDAFELAVFSEQSYYIFLAATGFYELVLVILFWLEVRRTKRKTVRIKTRGGGKAQLGVQSVAESLEYRIDELAGVRKVEPHIVSRGRDVQVRIDLDTSPSVNIPVLTDQIMDLCHDIVVGQLGVKIHGKVVINVRHEPYPRGTMAPTGPLGVEAVSTPPVLETGSRGPRVIEPGKRGAAELPAMDAGSSLMQPVDFEGDSREEHEADRKDRTPDF